MLSLCGLLNKNLLQQAQILYGELASRFTDTQQSLAELTSLVSRGITPKYTDDSSQVVLNQKCVRNHLLDASLGRKHSPKAINDKWLRYGDLLVNSTGEGTLGRTAQVWFSPDNMTVDSHVSIVRPLSEEWIYFIGFWGLTHEREIESLHTGSTGQTELPRERLKAMMLPTPDAVALAHFNESVAPMVQLITKNQQEDSVLSALRDSLLPRLMSGELDVSDLNL